MRRPLWRGIIMIGGGGGAVYDLSSRARGGDVGGGGVGCDRALGLLRAEGI